MPETISTEPPRHQSGGLAVALAKLDLDAITVADAVADVASMAGEKRHDGDPGRFSRSSRLIFKALRAETGRPICRDETPGSMVSMPA